jgi:hypothetical protein
VVAGLGNACGEGRHGGIDPARDTPHRE